MLRRTYFSQFDASIICKGLGRGGGGEGGRGEGGREGGRRGRRRRGRRKERGRGRGVNFEITWRHIFIARDGPGAIPPVTQSPF